MLRSRVRAWLARTADTGPGIAVAVARAGGRASRNRQASATRAELRDALAGVPLFVTLSPDELELLRSRATERFFEPGQDIIQQGVRADELFVILSGRARVVERPEDPARTEIVLGELGAGEIMGELAVLTGMPRSATVVAADAVRAVAIPGADFLRLLHTEPALAGALTLVLARRIYDTDRRLGRLAPDPMTGLLSRRSLEDEYPRIAALARRRQSGVLFLLLDIENLRAVNDRFGYGVGDDVVRAVAGTLVGSARRTDLIARWGGDEFAMLPVDARPTAVESIVLRLQQRLGDVGTRLGLEAPIRCVYGVGRADAPPDDLSELIRQADYDMQRRRAS
jgi:diguanylate cyclase (GGDEF)-like protein